MARQSVKIEVANIKSKRVANVADTWLPKGSRVYQIEGGARVYIPQATEKWQAQGFVKSLIKKGASVQVAQ